MTQHVELLSKNDKNKVSNFISIKKRNVKVFLFLITLEIKMVIFYSIQLSITPYASLSIPFSRVIFQELSEKGLQAPLQDMRGSI